MNIDPTTLRVGDILITDHSTHPRQRTARYYRNTALDGTPNDFIRTMDGHSVCLWQIVAVEPWTVDPRPPTYPWSKFHAIGDPVVIVEERK